MKKTITITILLLTVFQFKGFGQEKYGNALNLGIGIGGYYGYYRYVGNSIPVLHIDYEFDVAKNFTLAPSLNIHTYSKPYYWGNKNYPYRNYYYKETGFALGVKGAYYFDAIVKARSKWDFYVAGSIGFVAVYSRWDDDYYGDKNYYNRPNPLFLDLHVGTEYHINDRVGLFLDFSTGVSTLGLAIH